MTFTNKESPVSETTEEAKEAEEIPLRSPSTSGGRAQQALRQMGYEVRECVGLCVTATDLSRQAINQWMRGEGHLSAPAMAQIAMRYNLDLTWLILGTPSGPVARTFTTSSNVNQDEEYIEQNEYSAEESLKMGNSVAKFLAV